MKYFIDDMKKASVMNMNTVDVNYSHDVTLAQEDDLSASHLSVTNVIYAQKPAVG